MRLLTEVLREKFDFTYEEILVLEKNLIKRKIEKGQYFLKEGTQPLEFAFVEQGAFVYLRSIHEDQEVAIDFSFEDSWIADLNSVNSNLVSDLSIMALEDSIIYALSSERVKELTRENIKFSKC